MDRLKQIALKNFESQLAEHWISDTFPDCVREVYSTDYPAGCDLQLVLVATVRKHCDKICQKSGFRDVVGEFGDFAIDVITALAKDRSSLTTPWR